MDHLLTDTDEIKVAVAKATENIEMRLAKLEELISQTRKIKQRTPVLSPAVFALATQGNIRKQKETDKKIERSWSFGMMSIPPREDHIPEFDFSQTDADLQEVLEWIGHFKSFKPALEPKYLSMLNAYAHAESSGTKNLVKEDPHVHMEDASKAPKLSTSFGINTIHNIITSILE